jgi:hypothetical protein
MVPRPAPPFPPSREKWKHFHFFYIPRVKRKSKSIPSKRLGQREQREQTLKAQSEARAVAQDIDAGGELRYAHLVKDGVRTDEEPLSIDRLARPTNIGQSEHK